VVSLSRRSSDVIPRSVCNNVSRLVTFCCKSSFSCSKPATTVFLELSDVNLTKANLTNAVLRGAKLVDADLSEATCVGADLTGADMTGADTTGAIFELP
jgi:hypothetical protein